MANRPKISASMSKVSVNGEANGAAAHSTAMTAAKTRRRTSLFLAEHAAGAHDQHREHEQIHEGERQILEVIGAEYLDEGDQQTADDRAGEASHPADDHDHEGIDDDVRAHAEEGGDEGGREHAAERRHGAAEGKHAGA